MIDYRAALLDASMFVTNDGEFLPYKLRPNYEGYYCGKRIKVDADGFRIISPERNLLRKQPARLDEKEILLVGDSVVFGQGLSDEETIGSQLQNTLWETGVNYRVRNIGVPGYSSWNEYAAILDYLKKYQANVIVLIYFPNDITLNNDHFDLSNGRFTNISDTKFHQFTRKLYLNCSTCYLFADNLKRITSNQNNSGKIGIDEYLDDAKIKYSMEALYKVRNICEAGNIKFSVGVYRDVWHYNDPAESLKYEHTIVDNLGNRGIRSFVIKSHIDKLRVSEAKVYWNDPHPSSAAVKLIVSDIVREIREGL